MLQPGTMYTTDIGTYQIMLINVMPILLKLSVVDTSDNGLPPT